MDVYILAFETSTARCDVALLAHVQGNTQLISQYHDGAAEHAQHVLPMVDALLLQAGIDRSQLNAIAFGQGPGGFTGLRVACGLAQGMAFALGVPVIPVPSLLAVAEQDDAQGNSESLHLVLQDARMEELYAAAYQRNANDAQWQVVHAPCLLGRGDVGTWLNAVQQYSTLPVRLLGDGPTAFPELAALPGVHSVGEASLPQACAIARLAHAAWLRGETLDPALAAPLYVRDKVAYTTREREQGMGGNPKAIAPVPAASAAVASQPVEIIAMSQVHVAQVAKIERSVQAHAWTEKNFEDALAAGYEAWVAVQDNTVVGFCLVMMAPDVAHLLLIAIEPGRQRHGLGAQLLTHAQAHVLKQGLPSILLEVRRSNLQAQNFYQKHGFTQLSVRKNYYPAHNGEREDALILQKILRSEEMSVASGGGDAS